MNHDFSKRLNQLEKSIGGNDEEIVIRDEVVETPWSAGRDDRETSTAGISVTQHYRDENGNWISEGDE